MKALQDKIAQLFREKEQAKAISEAATDAADKHVKECNVKAATSKLEHLYVSVMSLLPKEKRTELHESFKQQYKAVIGDRRFELFVTSVNADDIVYPTKEEKEHFLLHQCTATVMNGPLFERFLTDAAGLIEEEKLNRVISEMDSYRSPVTNNIPVYFYKERIEKIKQDNKSKGLDAKQQEELDRELDIIANTVITSPTEYSRACDGLDFIYESEKNRRDYENMQKCFQKEEYKHIEDYFQVSTYQTNSCVRSVKDEQLGNTQIYKDVLNENVRLQVPQKTQDSLRKIIGFMKERGMIQPGYTAAEDGTKAYGFRQIAGAMIKLEQAMLTTDVEKIREARGNYERSLENMREVYKMIEEEFAPNEQMHVGNVSSYREEWLPGEFKNNLVYNALANGIYNLGLSLQNAEISLDEVFENPNAAFIKIMGKNAEGSTPNALLKGNSIASNMMNILNGEIDPIYPKLAVMRNVEVLSQLSLQGTDRERNALATMFLQSYDAYVDNNIRSSDASSISGYATNNAQLTFANIFLVNEADRDYDKLRSFESYTVIGEKKIPAFNTFEYLQNHKVDPSELAERINSAVNEVVTGEIGKGKARNIAKIIRGAQMAAYEYVMVHTAPDEVYDKNVYDQLRQMVDNPEKAFAEAYSNQRIANELEENTMHEYKTDVEKKGKQTVGTLRKAAHTAEKNYNNAVKGLTKTIESLTARINKGDDTEKSSQQLQSAREQLELLKVNEAKRLDEAYCKGELPRDYYEKRKLNVENGDYDKEVYFGVDEYPKYGKFKKQFKQELKDGEITEEEVEFLYQRQIENARIEENKLFLIAANIQQKPELAPVEAEINPIEEIPERLVIDELKESVPQQLSQKVQFKEVEKVNVKE